MAIKLAFEQIECIRKFFLISFAILMTTDEPRLELAVVSGSEGKIFIIVATVEKHPVPQETVYYFG
jgi:hypothetical protein